MNKLMAIDPSINQCGIAIYNIDTKELLKYFLLTSKEVIHNKDDNLEYIIKGLSIYNQILKIKNDENINLIVLEFPEYWRVAGFVARESGALFKLVSVCGMISTIQPIILVSPSDWKKQLPKEVTHRRLTKFYGDSIVTVKLNHNIVDAIGIGHFWLHGKV